MSRGPDKFDLYELAVTDAGSIARFLSAVHGGKGTRAARVLREDFCGTGALARGWRDADPAHRAVAVDRDKQVIGRAPKGARLEYVEADVMNCLVRCDILAATNFPVGYFHTRRELVGYLRHACRCLRPGGVFVCDMYGGSDVFGASVTRKRIRLPAALGGGWFWYEWEQVRGDATRGMVENAIHFELGRGGKRMARAFEYHWRLWSIPELREALLDAGFSGVEVYDRVGGAVDQTGKLHVRALRRDEPLDDPWVVYVAARK